jgi:soluble lytic murein transglycosylase-like protein
VLAGQAGVTVAPGPTKADGAALTYIVQPGDSLSMIAKRFSVATSDLAAANKIANPDLVLIGETLTIPVPAVKASSTLPPALLAHPERLALMPVFERWARAYNVPPDLLEALAWMESGWQNDAVSIVSARGIGQLTPATVDFVNDRLLGLDLDPGVAEDNIRMASRYVAYLMGRTGGDPRQTLAAYYQGYGALQRYGILPVTTLYVDDVLALQPLFS